MQFLAKHSNSLRARVSTVVGVAVLALPLGCNPGSIPVFSTPIVPDTADYTIDDIHIVPPPAGSLGNGTVQVIVQFTLHSDVGNVSPIVWVYEHDTFDNFPPQPGSSGDLGNTNPHEGAASLFASGGNSLMTSFTFTCGGEGGDEVLGPNGGGTGEGDWDSFPPQVMWDDAEIIAAVARRPPSGARVDMGQARWTQSVDMSCAEDPPDSRQFHIQHSP